MFIRIKTGSDYFVKWPNKTIISIRIKRFLIMLEKIGNIAYNIDINGKGR